MIINDTKRCSICQEFKPVSEFWKCKTFKDGLLYRCKPCERILRKDWVSKNKEKIKEGHRLWYKKNKKRLSIKSKEWYHRFKDKISISNKERYRALKLEIFKAYGHKCECCGESTYEFLSIDHIHGGGSKHRKKLGAKSVFDLIKREGFPKNIYRLLCFNCNLSLGFSGYCPHQSKK